MHPPLLFVVCLFTTVGAMLTVTGIMVLTTVMEEFFDINIMRGWVDKLFVGLLAFAFINLIITAATMIFCII